MRHVCSAAFVAFSVLVPSALFADTSLTPAEVTVGKNLETTATVALGEPAPAGGLRITLTSSDPSVLLLSSSPETAGSPTLVVTATSGMRVSPEFYVQGFASTGTATYTASAPGVPSGTGKVNLAPSAILLSVAAAASLNTGADSFATTTDAEMSNIRVYPALLDSARNFVARQLLAGGKSVTVEVSSSNAGVGTVALSPVTIPGGHAGAMSQFHPMGLGETTLAVSVPHGFSAPTQFGKVSATVRIPGIGMTHDISLGKDLQVCDGIFLAKPAPKDVTVTIASDNHHVLLNIGQNPPQADPITLTIKAGAKTGTFCMESHAGAGHATVTASAPGYASRTEAVTLTPSGFLLSFGGPPDEAELIRKEAAEKEHGIVTRLKQGEVSFGIFTAQLDPVSHRGADITVQPLRPGVKATLELKSSNPAVGTITSPLIAEGVGVSTTFTPLSVGKTVISLATPEGFTVPGNANAYTIIVTE